MRTYSEFALAREPVITICTLVENQRYNEMLENFIEGKRQEILGVF